MKAGLLANFDVIAEAPGGVAKLRTLILDLAVRGKLVPQNRTEPPVVVPGWASREATDESLLLPDGWSWTCVDRLGEVSPRNRAPDDTDAGFIPMTLIPVDYRDKAFPERRPWGDVRHGFTHLANGDVAVAKITPCFQNAKSFVVRDLPNGIGAGTTELHVIRPTPGVVDPNFLLIFFKSRSFLAGGVQRMTGTAGQQRVPRDYFANCPLGLPPLAEQHRIVAKVDELMALCDRLEQRQRERDAECDRLRASALESLSNAVSDIDLQAAWARVRDHLDSLVDSPSTVAAIRQSIAHLAVCGRLDHGSRMDWPTVRLDSVCDITSGVALGRKSFSGPTVWLPYLRVANVKAGYLDLAVVKEVEVPVPEGVALRLESGDVLLTEGGDWDKLGRSAIWDGSIPNCIHQNHIFRARCLPSKVLPRWVNLFTNSPAGRAYFQSCSKQTTNLASINMRQLRACPLPLPPIPEQQRVVAKVDQLMALCDVVEAALLHRQEAAEVVATSMLARSSSAPGRHEPPVEPSVAMAD